MVRILKRVLLGLVILIVVLVAVAYVLPREVHVERSVTIAASPAVVFEEVNSLKRFHAWSPWSAKDPNATYEFEGPDAGVGSKMSWEGNDDVGTGSQEITASRTNELVTTALDFGGQGAATASFKLAPEGEGTKVTWTLDTDLGMNPMARWFGLFFDGMIGADYEEGLQNLKKKVEQPSPPSA